MTNIYLLNYNCAQYLGLTCAMRIGPCSYNICNNSIKDARAGCDVFIIFMHVNNIAVSTNAQVVGTETVVGMAVILGVSLLVTTVLVIVAAVFIW